MREKRHLSTCAQHFLETHVPPRLLLALLPPIASGDGGGDAAAGRGRVGAAAEAAKEAEGRPDVGEGVAE